MLEVETIEAGPRTSGHRGYPDGPVLLVDPGASADDERPGRPARSWGEAVDDDRCTTAGPDVRGSYGSGYAATPENHLLGALLR